MEQNTLKGYIVSEKRGLFACASDEGGQYACRAATRFRNQNNAQIVFEALMSNLRKEAKIKIGDALEQQ